MNNPFELIEDIQARRLAFLEDTAKHYNENNRCSINGICQYRPSGPHTQGCAIGRWLERDNPIITLSSIPGSATIDCLEVYLPVWMREMGMDFLRGVQVLHDDVKCWDIEGITPYGESQVIHIKRMYGLK